MIFEQVICLGDSLTFGARSKAGWPEYMAQYLREKTGRVYVAINEGVSGETVLQLLRRSDHKLFHFKDVMMATLLIGTNDTKPMIDTPPDLFEELYRQVVDRLLIRKMVVFCGTIPDQMGEVCLPYDKSSIERLKVFNERIEKVCTERKVHLVKLNGFDADDYSDSLHFSDKGSIRVAHVFGDAILGR